ncbi:MAG TPA: hypothetical protein VGX68_02725 [Thermoanaerobaculia bacterium]|nr:hypothetical protein [Thermoanaerobaculia bacterium]
MSLPAATRRLFPDCDEADLTPERAGSLLMARVLEDGDAADLAWLLATIPEPALAEWFARHGGRQLSVRSRAFWEIVLGRAAGPAHSAAEALWPL